MSILRKVNRENFTTVENDILEDERLSFRARGIAVYLLSKPDNWTVNMKHLTRNGTEGLQAVRTALHELAEFGYIKRVRCYEDGKVMTLTQIADFPAFAHDGTTKQRINGYDPDGAEPDVQETDMSVIDMSETDRSEPDMSETDTHIVNTDAVKTDLTNTEIGDFGPKATARNGNSPSPNSNGPDPSDDDTKAFQEMIDELRAVPRPKSARDYTAVMVLSAVTHDAEGALFRIGIRDPDAWDWVTTQLARNIRSALSVSCHKSVRVEFQLEATDP